MPVFRFVWLSGLCDGEDSRERDLEWVAFPCGKCYGECCIIARRLRYTSIICPQFLVFLYGFQFHSLNYRRSALVPNVKRAFKFWSTRHPPLFARKKYFGDSPNKIRADRMVTLLLIISNKLREKNVGNMTHFELLFSLITLYPV